jgi:hypothetical protein
LSDEDDSRTVAAPQSVLTVGGSKQRAADWGLRSPALHQVIMQATFDLRACQRSWRGFPSATGVRSTDPKPLA